MPHATNPYPKHVELPARSRADCGSETIPRTEGVLLDAVKIATDLLRRRSGGCPPRVIVWGPKVVNINVSTK